MSRTTTYLELKYGNIYGGYPNFYAISDASLLVFEEDTERIFMESWSNNADVDIVSVFSKVDELGHTVGRGKEVINMRTRRVKMFDEEYRLDEQAINFEFRKLRSTRDAVKRFFGKNFRKYRIRDIIVFDGRRDIFLLEKSQVRFDRMNIIDLQKNLNQETDYLFSLNKLSTIINFSADTHLNSNNLKYWLHPIAARQVVPKTAAWDAARLLMVNNEYQYHKVDFLLKAQLLLNKIQKRQEQENS